LPELTELFRQLGYQTSSAELARRWTAQFGAADAQSFVAVDEGEVIGVLVLNYIVPLHEASPWGLISALVVEESARGTGAGAALLARAEEDAWRRGCGHIELSSHESREGAHRFYLRNGYAEVRKRFVKKRAV